MSKGQKFKKFGNGQGLEEFWTTPAGHRKETRKQKSQKSGTEKDKRSKNGKEMEEVRMNYANSQKSNKECKDADKTEGWEVRLRK